METETARILDINRAECEICCFANPQSVLGKHKFALLDEYPFSDREYRQYFAKACEGQPQMFAWCYLNHGKTIYVEISMSRIPIGDSFSILSLSRDITARRMDELELVKARASNLALIQAIPDTILVIRPDGSLADRWISEQDAAIFGNGDWQQHLADLFPGEVVYTISAAMKRAYEQRNLQLSEFWLSREGCPCFYEARMTVSGADEIVLILRNATAHKRLHEQMVRHSTLDAMTELHNRHFFEEQLATCARHSSAAVLICDVDGLKTINDTLGRQAGDRVLKTVACFLLDVFSVHAVIARIGGGEFAVLLIGESATKIDSLCDALKQRVEMHNCACPSLPVSISTGLASQKKLVVNGEVLFAEADNNMYREKMHQHKSGKNAVVQTLIKALEARDYITEGHCDRVQKELVTLAEAAGVAKAKKHDLKLFAQFHDIGKVGIPDSILFKPFGLTPEEWKVMQGHCEIGHRIARASSQMAPIAEWILKHHEWWNGQGYPQGLAGEAIPIECRMLAIVDAYDAMTNNRPYRNAISQQDAMEELKRAAGSQFDPRLVDLFTSLKKKC
jgi:diguanylate cyclase (GGDEF)-like protein